MNWKNMPVSHKIATVVAVLAVVFVLVCKLEPSLIPVDPVCPGIAVFTLCEAVIYWKEKRKWAGWLIAAASVSLICFILELVLTYC